MKPFLQTKLITATILFLALSVSNPFNSRAQYFLGLKIGGGISNLSFDGNSNFETSDKLLPNIAFVHNVRFKESKWGLNIETGFSNRGIKPDADNKFNLNYIDLPIMLEYYFTDKMKLNFGMELGYVTSGVYKVKDTEGNFQRNNFTGDIDKRLNFSGVAGLNYALDYFADFGFRLHLPFTDFIEQDNVLGVQNTQINYLQVFFLFKIAN